MIGALLPRPLQGYSVVRVSPIVHSARYAPQLDIERYQRPKSEPKVFPEGTVELVF